MKKNKFFMALMTTAITFGAVGAVALETTSAATADSSSSWIGLADSAYTNIANTSPTYAEDGYTNINNLASFGSRAMYAQKVRLDGLSVSFYMETNNRDCVGFYIGSIDDNAYASTFFTSLVVTNWHGLYSGQDRLHISNTHDYNKASVVYTTPACTQTGFSVAASHVSNSAEKMGYTVTFESYSETLYSVTVKMLYSSMWGNNANYNSTDKTSTVYLPKSTVAGELDGNGDAYVYFAGFPSGANPAPCINVKIDDYYTQLYQTQTVQPVAAKVAAYRSAVDGIGTLDDYNEAMALREQALSAIAMLNGRYQHEQTDALYAADQALANNAQVVTVIKNMILDKVGAAKNAFDAFQTESNLTANAHGEAVTLSEAAKAEFAGKKSMLNTAAITEIESAIAEVDYLQDYYKALIWIVEYEKQIDAIDLQSTTVGEDIMAVRAVKNSYAGSEAETLVAAMKEADKTAVNNRLAAAHDSLAVLENQASAAVKEAYLSEMEDAIAAGVSTYVNIKTAFEKWDTLTFNVTIESGDGDLYTRYTTAVTTLTSALETYLSGAIAYVDEMFAAGCPTLDSYLTVKAGYDVISLELLNDACPNKEQIISDYEKLTADMQAHHFADISVTNISLLEKNDMGLYFEMTAAFPNRINYNKKLNMAEGIDIEIELTNIAYYNGDISPEGKPKNANNLCINFMNVPDVYKASGGATGMNIIIWLYQNTASVQIVNNNDTKVAEGQITMPVDGGALRFSLQHGTYLNKDNEEVDAYVLTVNGEEIVLEKSVADQNKMVIPDECYFSFGSFADYTVDPNCFTLVKINDKVFAEDIPQPEKPNVPEKPDEQEGCNGIVSGAGIAVTLALVGVALVGKKRKENGYEK